MTYYMAVTPDKYELPLFVTPDIEEMAAVFGIRACSVRTAISSKKKGTAKGRKFIKVEV